MKTICQVTVLVLLMTVVLSCDTEMKTSHGTTEMKEKKETVSRKETPKNEPVEQEIATKKQAEKIYRLYGISFQLDDNWKLKAKDIKTTGLDGKVKKVETVYENPEEKALLRVVYYRDNKGRKIFEARKKETDKQNVKLIRIDNREGIMTTKTLTANGKGKPIDPPIQRIIVSFLNNDGNLVELKADISTRDPEVAINMLEDFLSTVKIND